jgi:hypothetical protein
MPAVSSMGPLPSPVAAAAVASLRRRRGLLVRLGRIERALRRWDARETNALLPEALRRPVVRPLLHREGLDGLQRRLTEELNAPTRGVHDRR